MNRRFLVCAGCLLFSLMSYYSGIAGEVTLAQMGKSRMPVVVGQHASERVQKAANTLAAYLGRMSGAEFKIASGTGESGLSVGTVNDFPTLELTTLFQPGDMTRREEYLIRSHASGVWIIGATDLAVEHAVWDLLYQLGYRQYFPGDTWEIVPDQPDLSVRIDRRESPDYLSRRIWYGFGLWGYNSQAYEDWCARNRCVQGLRLSTGHAYDRIVKTFRKEFDSHPEYWPLLDGKRQEVKNPKPCLGNPAVRGLFATYALNYFAESPDADSISMDPSDGGGWCECEKCARLGSVSDQVVTLANEVAEALQNLYPEKLIGIYAYNYHAPPPHIQIHPNVVVSVATAFIKGDLSLEEILAGWSKQGATLGIREYYSVNVWDRDQPAHALGGNLDYLARTIPTFHAKGARFMSAESSDNWGPNGLGYYLAARYLWDVSETHHTVELSDDFLQRAFGSAAEPMRRVYHELDGSQPHMLVENQLATMFRALEEARSVAEKSAVRERINHLSLYVHYCSLYHQYNSANGAERQAAFEALIRHAYRMRETMMVHTKALYRDLARRDKTVVIPEGAEWNVPEDRNPWKSSASFSEAEIASIIQEGIATYPRIDVSFEPVSFSEDLIPAGDRLNFPTAEEVGYLSAAEGLQSFYTYVERESDEIVLAIESEQEDLEDESQTLQLTVMKIGGPSETGERETRVNDREIEITDHEKKGVRIAVEQAGLYRIDLDSGRSPVSVTFTSDHPQTIRSTAEAPINSSYRLWKGFFYVPEGTTSIGLFGGDSGEIRDSQGRRLLWLNAREPGYYTVPVPTGEDGKIWEARHVGGDLRLLTVPSVLSLTPEGLLLPREVVEKDAAR